MSTRKQLEREAQKRSEYAYKIQQDKLKKLHEATEPIGSASPGEKRIATITPEELSLALPTPWKYLPHTFAMHLSEGKWRPFQFLLVLSHILTNLVAKGGARILVSIPPRHGKSEFISKWFPAWYLSNWPEDKIILTTYEADFAAYWGRQVRDIIASHSDLLGVHISDSAKASNSWETNFGGGMRTAGAGGPITGKGGHLLICDDPHKNWEEAMSPTIRNNIHKWYDSTFYTRADEERTSIIILHTRWHEDDMIGRLIAKQEGYVYVRFPALAEEENDILGRRQGAALCPERFSENMLNKIKISVGQQIWAGLYQQRPAAEEGNIFKRADMKYYKVTPIITSIMQSWDTGYKDTKGSAYSVCQTWGIGPLGYILLDQFRGMLEWPELLRKAKQLYRDWHPTGVLIEDKASGQSLIQELRRSTAIPVIPITPVLDKVLRAREISPLFESQRIWLPDPDIAPWVAELVDSWATFPNTKYLDETDTMTQMLKYWFYRSSLGAIASAGRRVSNRILDGFQIIPNAGNLWR